MRGAVAASGRRVGFCHVLHHGVASTKSADQQRSLIANHGPEPVIFSQSVSGGAGTCFLAQSEINSAYYFSLLVKIFESLLHAPIEQHVAIDLDALLLIEVLRIANGRYGSVKIASYLIANVVSLANLLHFERRFLQAIVGNVVGALLR